MRGCLRLVSINVDELWNTPGRGDLINDTVNLYLVPMFNAKILLIDDQMW